MAWGMANRPKASNKLGIPTPGEGSDGDMQVRQTNLGAKLFGKIGGRWHSTFLSREQEIVGTSGTAIGMSSSGTLSVNEIELTGKITLASRGTQNICIGTGNADTGQNNIVIGVGAGSSLVKSGTLPASNVLIGTSAGRDMVIGKNNVCIGSQSAIELTGDFNTCIGPTSGLNLIGGEENICIGYASGLSLETSDQSVCVGTYSGISTTHTNVICVGYKSQASGDYGIAIGDTIASAEEVITMGRNSDYITVDYGENASWAHSSDIRRKRNIQDNTLGLSFINDLKTRTFQWKPMSERPVEWGHFTVDDNGNKVYHENDTDVILHGFIAQEVKESLDKESCSTFKGWTEADNGEQRIAEAEFIIPLTKAVQELSTKVDAMQVEINNLT